MRIGIDVSSTVERETGKISSIGYYTYELVQALSKIDKDNKYILFHSFLPKSKRVAYLIDQDNFKSKIFKFPHKILDFCWNNFHLLSLEYLVGNIDIFHIPSFTFPITKKIKRIFTVHGLGFCKHPEFFSKKEAGAFQKMLKFLPKVDAIIAVSHSVKEELNEILRIPKEKIKVVYHGADKIFQPIKDKEEVNKRLSKYGIFGKYIISVGKIEPVKNFTRLIEAFAIFNRSEKGLYKLVIVGPPYHQYEEIFQKIRRLSLSNKIIFVGYVPSDELPYLYSGAKLFIRPSLYDSFGLSVLEAMACGTPAIVSNISSFVEIVENAGILVNPYNVEEIAEAIYKVLTNEELQNKMREKGLEKAKHFSWEKCARETLAVYEEVKKYK